jgi:hypothetical protein
MGAHRPRASLIRLEVRLVPLGLLGGQVRYLNRIVTYR